MAKVFVGTENECYIDGYLQTALDTAKEVVKKDWDMFFIVDGEEGTGKSVLAMQMAQYCDNSFTLDKVVFTPHAFKKAVMKGKPGEAIVYDEAYTGLSSRAAMSMINRIVVKMIAECRQRNLFVIVVMPTFFDLDKYVTLWRGRALIHVYSKGFNRGYFEFYDKDRKKTLYILGKKFYQYHSVKPNFRGRFTKHYYVDENEYRKKKSAALVRREDDSDKKILFLQIQKELFQKMITDKVLNEKIPNFLKAKILGVSEPTFYNWTKQFNEMKEFS